MRKLWNKLFKKEEIKNQPKILDPREDKYQVLVINDNVPDQDTSIEHGLGISDERKMYLLNKLNELFATGKYTCFIALAQDMTKECVHPNETYYIGFLCGSKHKEMNNPLMQIFDSARR